MKPRIKSQFFLAFENEMTDPIVDLELIIEEKQRKVIADSKRPTHNRFFLDKEIDETNALTEVCEKMREMKLYWLWQMIEMYIEKDRDLEVDGIVLIIPYYEDSKMDRMTHIDLTTYAE